MRHYEILSNNCIPYFLEINNIPDKTMTTFPKNKVSAIISEFDIENPDYKKLDKHIETLHNYTLKYLTCESSALYVINILNNIDNMESLNILMITANRMNYSMMSLAYGLRINLGNRFIDYPKINCLYNKQQFNLHINDDVMIDRTNIIEKIKRKEFDFIIDSANNKSNSSSISLDRSLGIIYAFVFAPKKPFSLIKYSTSYI